MNVLTISLLIAGFALLVALIVIACRVGIMKTSDSGWRLLLFVLCVVPYAILWFFYMSYYAILKKRPGGGGLKPSNSKSAEHDA